MASYRKHIFILVIFFAVIIGALLYYAVLDYSPKVIGSLFVIGIIFTLLPDIDTKSQGQYFFYLAAFILNLVLLLRKEYAYSALLGLVMMLPILSAHRSWSHKWYTAFVFPLLVFLVGYYYFNITDFKELLPYYGAGVLGYFVHLIIDRKL